MKAEIVRQAANVIANTGGDIARELAPVLIEAIKADPKLPRHIVDVIAEVVVVHMVLDCFHLHRTPNDDVYEHCPQFTCNSEAGSLAIATCA